ncbi:hypothetical protein BD293_3755 [Roseinatronobacter monicus]|uniref:Uncharacterized protein n=1 Tax=Roseinatronobacter monicus TaxID=393481 RepID=A0A543K5M0_9RHOB|nr:hypothetical protein BD293_3755 [Roseinatronobacter monicus]
MHEIFATEPLDLRSAGRTSGCSDPVTVSVDSQALLPCEADHGTRNRYAAPRIFASFVRQSCLCAGRAHTSDASHGTGKDRTPDMGRAGCFTNKKDFRAASCLNVADGLYLPCGAAAYETRSDRQLCGPCSHSLHRHNNCSRLPHHRRRGRIADRCRCGSGLTAYGQSGRSSRRRHGSSMPHCAFAHRASPRLVIPLCHKSWQNAGLWVEFRARARASEVTGVLVAPA